MGKTPIWDRGEVFARVDGAVLDERTTFFARVLRPKVVYINSYLGQILLHQSVVWHGHLPCLWLTSQWHCQNLRSGEGPYRDDICTGPWRSLVRCQYQTGWAKTSISNWVGINIYRTVAQSQYQTRQVTISAMLIPDHRWAPACTAIILLYRLSASRWGGGQSSCLHGKYTAALPRFYCD